MLLKPDSNAIYTVGCNDEGQLGTGDMEHHTVPQFVELSDEAGPIRQVSAGSNHTAILTGMSALPNTKQSCFAKQNLV